jgi:5-methylthioribose kinase
MNHAPLRLEFARKHPHFPLLTAGDTALAQQVLSAMGVLKSGETVTATAKAGEGNMNLTLRVTLSSGRTVILKQSRPWVEKYDFIAAPGPRANLEAAFYRKVAGYPAVADKMPRLLGQDPHAYAFATEDLGAAADLFSLYTTEASAPGGGLSDADLTTLASFLRALHDAFRGHFDRELCNHEMRDLNHAHIFALPISTHSPMPDDKLDALSPGLASAAHELKADSHYTSLVFSVGEAYLIAQGPCLLHGDFFPGSVLRLASGELRVIDPEFAFFGPPEFDLGVFVAHLALARQSQRLAQTFLSAYGMCDLALLSRIAGIEVMRRLIGVAQLPLSTDLDRSALLRKSKDAVLSGDLSKLFE